jgi:hypothetical protein
MEELEMANAQQEPRRRGWFGRILGLAAIVGAGALWRQRQRQRDLDEELWGDPREFDGASSSERDVPPVRDKG